ncbi:hypothetical protein [Dongia sp.]|uniref:hypothetical protein n=1 Tax=Dongia sp. TaxID=1977262 RepID=UPI0035B2C0EC
MRNRTTIRGDRPAAKAATARNPGRSPICVAAHSAAGITMRHIGNRFAWGKKSRIDRQFKCQQAKYQ